MQTKKVLLGIGGSNSSSGAGVVAQQRPMTVGETFICGGVAGVIVSPLVGPIELLKTQLQVNKSRAGSATYEGTIKVANWCFVETIIIIIITIMFNHS
jgi:hypothetical protein